MPFMGRMSPTDLETPLVYVPRRENRTGAASISTRTASRYGILSSGPHLGPRPVELARAPYDHGGVVTIKRAPGLAAPTALAQLTMMSGQ
jgi:hypothetical protein